MRYHLYNLKLLLLGGIYIFTFMFEGGAREIIKNEKDNKALRPRSFKERSTLANTTEHTSVQDLPMDDWDHLIRMISGKEGLEKIREGLNTIQNVIKSREPKYVNLLQNLTPLILINLSHKNQEIRKEALETFLLLGEHRVITPALLSGISIISKKLIEIGERSPVALFDKVNQRLIRLALSLRPTEELIAGLNIGKLGITLDTIKETNKIFESLDLDGLPLGSQEFIKLWVLIKLRDGNVPQHIENEVKLKIIPIMKIIYYVEKNLPAVGIQTFEPFNPNDATELLPEISILNYVSFIQTPNIIGLSGLSVHRLPYKTSILKQANLLYRNTHPTTLTAQKLLLDLLIGFDTFISLIGSHISSEENIPYQSTFIMIEGNLKGAALPISLASFLSHPPSMVAGCLVSELLSPGLRTKINNNIPSFPYFDFFYGPTADITRGGEIGEGRTAIIDTPFLTDGMNGEWYYLDSLKSAVLLSAAYYGSNSSSKGNNRNIGKFYEQLKFQLAQFGNTLKLSNNLIEMISSDSDDIANAGNRLKRIMPSLARRVLYGANNEIFGPIDVRVFRDMVMYLNNTNIQSMMSRLVRDIKKEYYTGHRYPTAVTTFLENLYNNGIGNGEGLSRCIEDMFYEYLSLNNSHSRQGHRKIIHMLRLLECLPDQIGAARLRNFILNRESPLNISYTEINSQI